MKRLTQNQWRDLRIFNSHGIAARADSRLFLAYDGPSRGRMSSSAAWCVYGLGFKTDKGAAWYDNYNKTFMVWNRTEKQEQLELAMLWAEKKYRIEEWERDAFGNYQIKGTMAKAAKGE